MMKLRLGSITLASMAFMVVAGFPRGTPLVHADSPIPVCKYASPNLPPERLGVTPPKADVRPDRAVFSGVWESDFWILQDASVILPGFALPGSRLPNSAVVFAAQEVTSTAVTRTLWDPLLIPGGDTHWVYGTGPIIVEPSDSNHTPELFIGDNVLNARLKAVRNQDGSLTLHDAAVFTNPLGIRFTFVRDFHLCAPLPPGRII